MTTRSSSIFEFRDVFIWIALSLALLLFKADLALKWRRLLLLGIGIMASLMLYISIDRGVLLFICTLVGAIVLVGFQADIQNRYSFRPKRWRYNMSNSLLIIGGIILGMGVPGLLLGRQSFADFIKLTFVEIPSYGGLLVSQPFPQLFSPTYLIWGPVLLAIAIALLLLRLFTVKDKKELNMLLPYTFIFLFAAACIKMGSNRIDVVKMASVTAPLFLISFLILFYAVRVFYRTPVVSNRLVLPIMATVLVIVAFAHLDFSLVLRQPDYRRADLTAYKNLRHTSDDQWISPETKQVRDYIVTHTAKQAYLFDFTSDPAYYYLTDRQNPSRFFISWYTDPQPYTDELLSDLKRHPPAVIVYSENTWMDAPDNIGMKERIPEVNAWILAYYHRTVRIGNTTLLEP